MVDSVAITGHSVLGVSRIALTRSMSLLKFTPDPLATSPGNFSRLMKNSANTEF